MSHAPIEVRDLRHRVPGESVDLLDGLNLTVANGEFVTIRGRSGSGKSTLLTMLGLMAAPQVGTIRVCGACPRTDAERARARAERLGFVFQNYSLMASRTAMDNVALPLLCRRLSLAEIERRASGALLAVGLQDKAHQRAGVLSGGEQQRVAIARALIGKPTIVLADEPTGALDGSTAEVVMSIMIDQCRTSGVALVVVTHDRHVARLGDRQLVLEKGRLTDVVDAP